mmetsp:Transcript_29743/g.86712  ORF Transcript_29743/g.86712 Transcript_29743/m.86712 type:complete len:97 (-) Transcript_29743:784-1074(-)
MTEACAENTDKPPENPKANRIDLSEYQKSFGGMIDAQGLQGLPRVAQLPSFSSQQQIVLAPLCRGVIGIGKKEEVPPIEPSKLGQLSSAAVKTSVT